MNQSFATSAHLAPPGVPGSPTIELDELMHDFLLGLVFIAGGGREAGRRPVQWVHSSDLADPSPFLMPRTVLLTTGAQFDAESDTAEFEDYVSRLIGAGVTALGLGVGLRWDRIPPALVEVCDRLRLPLFRVPYDTPFLAVVRTATRLIEATATIDWDREQATPPSVHASSGKLARLETALRSTILQLMLSGQQTLAEQAASGPLPPLPRGAIFVCVFEQSHLRHDQRFATEFAALTNDRDGVLTAAEGSTSVTVAESARRADLKRMLTRHEIAAGVSERGTMSDLPELLNQAKRAAELAGRRAGDLGPLDYQPAMHAGVLQVLQGSAEAMRRARGLLAPLQQHDSRHNDEILLSLTAWLAHNGLTSPAATELGVHRHTLRHRLQTAESLLQRSLDDPDTRTELWAALKLTGSTPPA